VDRTDAAASKLLSSSSKATIAIDARKVRDFGIGTYIRNLVFELARLDSRHRYILLVGPIGWDAFADLPPSFERLLWRSPCYSARELFTLTPKLLGLKVDLYHATHYVLPYLLPCRAVVTIHDIIHLLYPEFLPNRLAFLYAERMIRRALEHGDRILTVSRNTKADLERYFDIAGDKIETIYNGIDETFRQPIGPADLPERLRGLGIEPGYVLFVGNPKPHKNLDNVLKAYALAAKEKNLRQPLVCVGDREGIDARLRMRAEQLGVADKLVLLGHVDQEVLPAIYQGAGLFLYPTLYEGFGLPVVEAMASGVPVITSNTSALKEIAEGHAHLVNPLDVAGMAQAIVECLSDESHRESLRQLGRRRATDFSWRKTAEQTLEVYEQVLAGKSREKAA
jgi:glycosyltransferase involved in cell wall biosynthesis